MKEFLSIAILPSDLHMEYDEGVMTWAALSGTSRVTVALVGTSTHFFKLDTTEFGIF